MKKTVISLALFFSFLISTANAQSPTAIQFPPEIEKFYQAIKVIASQISHSPAFNATSVFDPQTHEFVIFTYSFSSNNEMIAKEIASIAVSDITLANYQEKAESFTPKIRASFREREAAQQRGELKSLDSFITLTQTEDHFWRLFDGFIFSQQAMTQELIQTNDKFIEIRIFPGLSNGQRVFHFYIGVDESQSTKRQLHYYPVAEFPISQITSTREPVQELAADLSRAFEAAKNKLRQLR